MCVILANQKRRNNLNECLQNLNSEMLATFTLHRTYFDQLKNLTGHLVHRGPYFRPVHTVNG